MQSIENLTVISEPQFPPNEQNINKFNKLMVNSIYCLLVWWNLRWDSEISQIFLTGVMPWFISSLIWYVTSLVLIISYDVTWPIGGEPWLVRGHV